MRGHQENRCNQTKLCYNDPTLLNKSLTQPRDWAVLACPQLLITCDLV